MPAAHLVEATSSVGLAIQAAVFLATLQVVGCSVAGHPNRSTRRPTMTKRTTGLSRTWTRRVRSSQWALTTTSRPKPSSSSRPQSSASTATRSSKTSPSQSRNSQTSRTATSTCACQTSALLLVVASCPRLPCALSTMLSTWG